MIARCIANRGRDIPQYLGVLFFDPSIQFEVIIGGRYPVLGMELYRDVLQILVPGGEDSGRPQWLPLELFDVDKSKIPTDWHFRAYPNEAPARQCGFRARWGYRELVESDEHRDGLEQLDPPALTIFAEELARTAE